jgi:hypothetical protein
MGTEVYRYSFIEGVSMTDVRESVLLAAFAAEGVHGRTQVLLDAGYHVDEKNRACVVDATAPVGKTICQIFTSLLAREFGEGAFRVERFSAAVAPTKKR